MRYWLLLTVLLGGCATPEIRAAREAAQFAKYEAQCTKLGFQANTEAMAQCKLSLLNTENLNNQASSGVAAQNAANVREAMRLKTQ